MRNAATPETIYDLASLTKVLATTTLAMRAVDAGRLQLSDPVGRWLPAWRGAGSRARDDPSTSSRTAPGFRPTCRCFRDYAGRVEFEQAICSLPLEYEPGTQSIYSDLGFILLGFILEDAAPKSQAFAGAPGSFDPSASLDAQFHRVRSFVTPEPLAFNPPRAWRTARGADRGRRMARRLLTGEVHDENCWALGGAAGHAGLFGTAGAVGAFARAVLRTIGGEAILALPETMHEFMTQAGVPGELPRARLGHDAPDVLLRHADVGRRHRPYRLHRHFALD